MPFGPTPRTDIAPLRQRDAVSAPAGMVSVIDETLHIVAGSACDLSGLRTTAVPAGSRGRVTVSGRNLLENGSPVKFNICTWQPEYTYLPIPSDSAAIDAGAAYLARCGFNAIRIMGLEHYAMRGVSGAATYNASVMDRFDYFLAACKREGIYWILCVQSNNLFMDLGGINDRFSFTAASGCKPRMFVEQGVRDNWKAGVSAFYNRVNKYTGTNILQDPACLMFELFNEASTIFCNATSMPPMWLTRAPGTTAAAQIWGEWLADTSKAHGYANVAALNASWGTAYSTYAEAAAAAVPAADNILITQTQQAIDMLLYLQYLEDGLAEWYTATMTDLGFQGIQSMHCMYPNAGEMRAAQKLAPNQVTNWHQYRNLVRGDPAPGSAELSLETPVWETNYPLLMDLWAGGAKPMWFGEGGDVAWSTWREQYAMGAASRISGGSVALNFFIQGDFFYPSLYNDTTYHGLRFSRVDVFSAPCAHANDFLRPIYAALTYRGDIAELSGTPVDLTFNDRYLGTNPRSTFRAKYHYLYGLPNPLFSLAAITKCRLTWSSDTSDDSLATTWRTKDWYTLLSEQLSAGAIAADHPSLVSATTNHGSITAIADTGTVGGMVASKATPVLTLGAAHTLVTGDVINAWGISGTAGDTFKNQNLKVQVGTGNNVKITSGMDLTSHSGYATGTWCEGPNVLVSGHKQWGWSRREKRAWINVSRLVYLAVTSGASMPMTFGSVTITSLTADCSVYVLSLDGPISTSTRLLLGLCGVAENTGMTFTDGTRQTLSVVGTYPAKQNDASAVLALALTRPQEWTLYRLQRNGARGSAESITSIDAAAGRVNVTLRTGTIQPTCVWELIRP